MFTRRVVGVGMVERRPRTAEAGGGQVRETPVQRVGRVLAAGRVLLRRRDGQPPSAVPGRGHRAGRGRIRRRPLPVSGRRQGAVRAGRIRRPQLLR